MSNDRDASAKPTAKEAREARLAAALRDNLRRRKAAASGDSAGPAADIGGEDGERAPESG